MDKEIRKLALRQYLKYFKWWFIAVGILLAFTLLMGVGHLILQNRPRNNSQADAERVYDYADVLTDAEEEELRQHIAKYEQKSHVDMVIVTINEAVGATDSEWEDTMMNISDDFYDEGKFGWNKAHGDGALLLDNWYEDENGSQKGTWLSTSGKMEDIVGWKEENDILDNMYKYIDRDVLKAYKAAVVSMAHYGALDDDYDGTISYMEANPAAFFGILEIFVFIVALIYGFSNMAQSKAKDTTMASTYVENGRPVLRDSSDTFIRKTVTQRRIESSSGGSGGHSSHSGGGSHGHHTSRGGHSHGGGGRRR